MFEDLENGQNSMATSSRTSSVTASASFESCTWCSEKYNRTRASLCHCKHCPLSLCLACMKDHHDELLQTVTLLSHQYNEIQELVRIKKKMVNDEATQSTEHVCQWFKVFINELFETEHKIILSIEKTKKDAQSYLVEVQSELQALSIDIQALAKEGVFQPTQMDTLFKQLNRIQQQINSYEASSNADLRTVTPTYSLEFKCTSTATTNAANIGTSECSNIVPSLGRPASDTIQPLPLTNRETTVGLDILQDCPEFYRDHFLALTTEDDNESWQEENEEFASDDDNSSIEENCISTSFTVDRMASDGTNVMYTSYQDDQTDVIAYCYMDPDCANSGVDDPYHDWNQSRIEDMIWWGSIGKFVCATRDAIYIVEYNHGKFKIVCVLRNNWSNIRITGNTNHFWLYTMGRVEDYNSDFQLIRVINVSKQKWFNPDTSLCMTDNLVAFASIHRVQETVDIMQVHFYNFAMHRLKTVRLGKCSDSSVVEIRSDGKTQFFVTTGSRTFHIVSPNGYRRTMKLGKSGDCLAVLDGHRVVVSDARDDMEIISY